MFELPTAPRLLIEADLAPLQGTRFQPTGFPDIGAGHYQLHDGTEMVLVESAQSVANRLEAVCWDEASGQLPPCLSGLPYVEVSDGTGSLTNSVLEAHRLNSAYIENSDAFEGIRAAIGFDDKRPFDRKALVRALARYDIGCLLHGVFLESIAGVLRLPRALSGFIEARDVSVVAVGGVKNDRVRPGKDAASGATADQGYGNVPYHRDEYTAGSITAFFNLDLDQIRSYGLGEAAERLLFALACWKIGAFLERGLRLRTACDLDLVEVRVKRPTGAELPSRSTAEAALLELIRAARDAGLYPADAITRAVFKPKAGKAGKGS